jgi:hypothetical protein
MRAPPPPYAWAVVARHFSRDLHKRDAWRNEIHREMASFASAFIYRCIALLQLLSTWQQQSLYVVCNQCNSSRATTPDDGRREIEACRVVVEGDLEMGVVKPRTG